MKFNNACLILAASFPSQATACDRIVYCLAGQAQANSDFTSPTGETCEQACGGNCCTGTDACSWNKISVCADVDDGSCDGPRACAHVGQTNGGTVGLISGGSCVGSSACESMGSGAGSVGTVSGGSCRERNACAELGWRGSVGNISGGSCVGGTACNYACKGMSTEVTSGCGDISGSCVGSNACIRMTMGDKNIFPPTTLNNCCIGNDACKNAGCNLVQNDGFPGAWGHWHCDNPRTPLLPDTCSVVATQSPTTAPTEAPTTSPTTAPTQAPITSTPTQAPTFAPTLAPTSTPTQAPTSPGPWTLTYDNITASFTSGADNEIEVGFVVGAGREVSVALYETCDAEAVEMAPGAVFSRTVTHLPEHSNSTHSMITIGYNFNKTSMIGSDLWNSATDVLTYCQVTSLVTTGANGAEWVIVEDRREIEIQFDLEADFIVDVALADEKIENATETVSFDDQVRAFKCQVGSTNPFVGDDTALAPNQELAVCIISENDSVNLAKLTDMVIEQDTDRVDVVTDDNIVIPAITDVILESVGIMVKTRVPIDKFTFETGETITIRGEVELDLTNGRRLRALVGEDNAVVVEEAGYTVTVNLQSEGDSIGEVQAPIGSSAGHAINNQRLGALGLMILAVIGLVV